LNIFALEWLPLAIHNLLYLDWIFLETNQREN
jgi:hypothetical protein